MKTKTLFLVSLIAMMSCKKDVTIIDNSNSGYPKFETYEELEEKVSSILKMNEEERISYEKANNYKSLKTECIEKYKGFDIEKNDSETELEKYVNLNKEFVNLTRNQDNELEYSPNFEDNKYNVIVNKTRIYAVGYTFYKVFNDGLISCEIRNLEDLKSIKDINIPSNVSEIFKVTRFKSFNTKNFNINTCLNEYDIRTTNGRDRTRLIIQMEDLRDLFYPYPIGIKVNAEIRAYRRTLVGVWYRVERTMSGNIKYTIEYPDFNGNIKINQVNHNINSRNPIYESLSVFKYEDAMMNSEVQGARFLIMDSWASTPSTGVARAQCNN
jgi:hypothetical protein